MIKVLFMVRRAYFEAIVLGDKTWEFRRASPRWQTIFDSDPQVAVFQCGHRLHHRYIVGRTIFPNAEAALGRAPTSEHFAMLGYGKVLGFQLGGEMHG